MFENTTPPTDNRENKSIKILLIDDNENSYILTRQLFKKFADDKLTLHWVDSYEKALDEMQTNAYEVYLLDYRLGKKNGLDLLREARRNGCAAPVVFFTSQSDKQLIVEALRSGAVDYLVKGEFDAVMLERSIRYALENARALQAFNASEDRYRTLVETLPLMFYLVEPKPPFAPFYVSPAFAALGYPLKMWLEKPETWLKAIHQEDRQHVLDKFNLAVETGDETNFTYRMLTKSGEVRWMQDRGRLLKNEAGQVTHWQGFMIDITERRQAEAELEESEERYRNLFENANDIVYVHDLDGNYLSVNQAAERIFGYDLEEISQMNMDAVIVPEELEFAHQKLKEKITHPKQTAYEITCLTKNGTRIPLEINSCVVYKNGAPVAIQGIARDITERKKAEESIKKNKARYRELFENANDLIYTHDLKGNFTSLNRAGEMITGYSRDKAMKMKIEEVVAPEYIEKARQIIADNLLGRPPAMHELEILSKQGHRVTLELSTTLIEENGKPVGVQGIARDITERKKTQEQLKHHALYDTLTNLPNRSQFMSELKATIKNSKTQAKPRFAVLFLDLDRFKIINDSLGHQVGDKLLVAIAGRIKQCLRAKDVVARLGGDEFTILITNMTEDSDAVLVAERLQRQLSKPFKLDSYEVFTSASIGIVISDGGRRTPEELLRDADTAMYRAKESGKARYEIFDREMHVRNMNLLQIETDLRRAIEREEFEVYYQPIVDLETGGVSEFEALIRWRHPEFGLVPPNDFICVAEETGLIIPIGRWVLEAAARQAREWQTAYKMENRLSISVNLSAKQLIHPNLVGQVKEILESSELAPECLKLEVTESMVMENGEKALAVLTDLHRLGISLSTDDFGTGYSSLSYLHRFPFERLKIDRSFINKMDSESKSEVIVRTIMMLGKNLQIGVVAEGIETEQQLAQLRSLGCKLGQGYIFSKPVDAEAAAGLLQNGLPEQIVSLGKNLLIPAHSEEYVLSLGNLQ